jgi:hypothetical protein
MAIPTVRLPSVTWQDLHVATKACTSAVKCAADLRHRQVHLSFGREPIAKKDATLNTRPNHLECRSSDFRTACSVFHSSHNVAGVALKIATDPHAGQMHLTFGTEAIRQKMSLLLKRLSRNSPVKTL